VALYAASRHAAVAGMATNAPWMLCSARASTAAGTAVNRAADSARPLARCRFNQRGETEQSIDPPGPAPRAWATQSAGATTPLRCAASVASTAAVVAREREILPPWSRSGTVEPKASPRSSPFVGPERLRGPQATRVPSSWTVWPIRDELDRCYAAPIRGSRPLANLRSGVFESQTRDAHPPHS